MKEVKIEYILYNNKDFKNIVFCKSLSEAKIIKSKLKKLKHISNIKIIGVKNERD